MPEPERPACPAFRQGESAGKEQASNIVQMDFDDYEEKLTGSMDKALADFDDITALDMAARFVRKTTRFLNRSYEALKDPPAGNY